MIKRAACDVIEHHSSVSLENSFHGDWLVAIEMLVSLRVPAE